MSFIINPYRYVLAAQKVIDAVLLLHCDGTDESTSFPDDSPSDHTVTANAAAQVDTAISKFGTGSCLLDGTDDYLEVPDSGDWVFGTGDFGIDGQVNFSAGVSNPDMIAGYSNGDGDRWQFYRDLSGRLIFWARGALIQSAILGWNTSQWYHLCAVRSDGSVYIYRDGVLVASGAFSTDIIALTGTLTIGANFEGSSYVNFLPGSMDEVRISKGTAPIDDPDDPLYISSGDPTDGFTPPTNAYVISTGVIVVEPSWDTSTSNQENACTRMVISASNLLLSASVVTINFDATQSPSESLRIDNAYIGHQGAGDDYDFDGSQARITFNTGSNGFVISSGASITSDEITVALDSSKDLVISFDWTNNSDNTGSFINSGATGYHRYVKAGANPDASTTNPSGYSDGGSDNVAIVGEITKIS